MLEVAGNLIRGEAVVIELRTYLSISMGPSSQLPGAFGSALR